MRSRKKKDAKIYQPRIHGGEEVRKKVETISAKTGKKMYAVVEEALLIGLDCLVKEK